jgi:hypothetical protein
MGIKFKRVLNVSEEISPIDWDKNMFEVVSCF